MATPQELEQATQRWNELTLAVNLAKRQVTNIQSTLTAAQQSLADLRQQLAQARVALQQAINSAEIPPDPS